jgi:TolB-like protein
MLTRKQSEIIQNELDSKYALIGSYTFTKESLIVFMRLVDLQNGTILSSATGSTLMDGEIKDMERESKRLNVITPMVL